MLGDLLRSRARAAMGRRQSRIRRSNDVDTAATPPGGRAAAPCGAGRWLPEQVCTRADENQTCEICLENYAEGEKMKRLPCLHSFHSRCIDSWLCEATTCPQCRHDIFDNETGGGSSGSSSSSRASRAVTTAATTTPLALLLEGLNDDAMDPVAARRFAALTPEEQEEAYIMHAYLTDLEATQRRLQWRGALDDDWVPDYVQPFSRRSAYRRHWNWLHFGRRRSSNGSGGGISGSANGSSGGRGGRSSSRGRDGDGASATRAPRMPSDPFPSRSRSSSRANASARARASVAGLAASLSPSSPRRLRRSQSLGATSERRHAHDSRSGSTHRGPSADTPPPPRSMMTALQFGSDRHRVIELS